MSPEEDFANNLEYYLFDPKTLNRETPGIIRWIKERMGPDFKVEVINK